MSVGSRVAIVALGTAEAGHRSQAELGRWLGEIIAADGTSQRLIDRLFRAAAIAGRPIAASDPRDPVTSTLYEKGLPSLEDRMRAFERAACRLASEASAAALGQARLASPDISHLVVVSSTGAGSPSPDVHLGHALGLAPSVERYCIAGQGCAGALAGLALSKQLAAAHPAARVLLCCVEICSIHLRDERDPETLVGDALFGDAAAAVVIRSEVAPEDAIAYLGGRASALDYANRDLVAWTLDDAGFRLRLSRRLPAAVGASIAGFVAPLVAELTGGAGTPAEVGSWAVHPGGRAVLAQIQKALALPAGALESSGAVLERVGNLSSSSVLFVLDTERRRRSAGTTGIMLAFGPGLSFEAMTYTLGGARPDR